MKKGDYMYSVTELAKIFKTTRTTIYRKLKHKDLQEFITENETGKKLMKEGFNQFQIIMSNSKVDTNITTKVTEVDNTFNDKYIQSLNDQIDTLKADKTTLLNQLEKKDTQIENTLNLLKESQNKVFLLSERKKEKVWWKFWQ